MKSVTLLIELCCDHMSFRTLLSPINDTVERENLKKYSALLLDYPFSFMSLFRWRVFFYSDSFIHSANLPNTPQMIIHYCSRGLTELVR